MPKFYSTTTEATSSTTAAATTSTGKNYATSSSVGSKCTTTNRKNFDTILLLERSLDRSGQQWVENLNVIEQFIVDIVENVGQSQPILKSNFILRRLPMYTTSYTNKNEYAVVLNNFDFTLLSPRRHSTLERKGAPNFGQIEIFCKSKGAGGPLPLPSTTINTTTIVTETPEKCVHGRELKGPKIEENVWSQVVNDNNAFCSHEIFKKFAKAFTRAANSDHEEEEEEEDEKVQENPEPISSSSVASSSSVSASWKNVETTKRKEKVQLISPHLLPDLMTNVEVSKIFTLSPTTKIEDKLNNGKSKTALCRISINYLKSFITISLEDTEVTVKPCLFCDQGYTRVNSNLLDRIPLFHPNILSICDALGKGCLLFPTSFETLWTLQFWPCESHLICIHHPSSLLARVFKLYSAFCLNPLNFWETLNNCFLIGTSDDMTCDSLSDKNGGGGGGTNCQNDLSMDFLVSTFLFEMEKFSRIEDWAPRNFYSRFMHLVRSSVDSYEKGFHAHYFTKINILRGIWKDSNFDKEESSVLKVLDKELDDIEEFPEDQTDCGERTADYLDNDDDEDYGLHFDTLETTEGEEDDTNNFNSVPPPPLMTSDMVYRSVNPFQSTENLPGSSTGPLDGTVTTSSTNSNSANRSMKQRKVKTLSKMFGSNLLRRLTSSLGRSQSDAGDRQNQTLTGTKSTSTRSMADVTSGFEESVAQTRREQSLNRHLRSVSPTNRHHDAETSFTTTTADNPSSSSYGRARSHSVPASVAQINGKKYNNNNMREENGRHYVQPPSSSSKSESIYSNILQILVDTPPSDHLSDSEVIRDLEKCKKILESQDELIEEWSFIMSEALTPKIVCPHTFSPRQVQYLAHVIQKTSRCSPSAIKLGQSSVMGDNSSKCVSVPIPAWEISGDLLRIVLHQMRSEPALHDSFKEKQKPVKRLSLKGLKMAAMSSSSHNYNNHNKNGEGDNDHDDESGGGRSSSKSRSTSRSASSLRQKLSFKKRHADVCTGHLQPPGSGEDDVVDVAGETQFALEEPEVAATNRLLQWLWQLKTSDIGRLSFKAKKYLEYLHRTSYNGSHFMEQFTEEKVFQSMAIRSAVAVSRIMADEKFPAYVPLLAASKKGWLWAEMILSLASWNHEKGFPILADVPWLEKGGENEKEKRKILLRDIYMTGTSITNTLKKMKHSDPDAEAVTLAFHSELATPLGWNDFEDPRRPGPFTVPILIFSSLGYFKQWEMVSGNIVQVMVRLQKFNNLQHVGALLEPPHRKTALNEVRKLNKSLSSRTFQFDDNVMSKTFKRLASLRSTRKLFSGVYSVQSRSAGGTNNSHSCKEIGCAIDSNNGQTKTVCHNGKEFECTRL